MLNPGPLYVLAESAPSPKEGWTPQIIDRLPEPSKWEWVRHCAHLFVLYPDLNNEVAGIVLIGTMSWDENSAQGMEATLRLLRTLREQGYPGEVVYLTDFHRTDADKAPFLAAFPKLKILFKTPVANGHLSLPF